MHHQVWVGKRDRIRCCLRIGKIHLKKLVTTPYRPIGRVAQAGETLFDARQITGIPKLVEVVDLRRRRFKNTSYKSTTDKTGATCHKHTPDALVQRRCCHCQGFKAH
jgi:hypothetical protein